ncbi:polyketide synthase [Streptomyces platensis]|uniref:polyketide synthase n=1 Tax=Streptomyces platensis TaxID=58346 RepID=UPI0027E3F575|nr:polyketide synthase [Streptomyces platensis]MCF3142729.1 type I polyketide synthase [Streptomyces platensis]
MVIAGREDVALRLFAFPHAGGNHNSFQTWASGLPGDVEVISYSLPGRGRQQDEPPYQEWQSLIGDLVDFVRLHDDGAPFAFFGHSFGALVAFEVCRQLRLENRRGPAVLFVSAHRAPHLSPGEQKRFLPQERFVGLVREWGLVPEELLADDELLQLVLPPLRADVTLDEEYRCRTGGRSGGRLSVPCVVYGGAEDPTVCPEQLPAWREHFDDDTSFGVEILPGGHFYTLSAQDALLESISGHLDRVRAEVGPSVALDGPRYSAPGRSVWERFGEYLVSRPDDLALVDGVRRWSYRELGDSASALASELAALGTAKGDVVGLLLPHSAEYCVSLLSCFGIGAPACLLEKNWPASLLAQFLESAGVKTVVATPELAGLLPPSFRKPDKLLLLNPERCAGSPADGLCIAPRHSERCTGSVAGAEPVVFPDVELSDIALISMTSGTSGTPKAVLNTHLGCLYCFDARYARYPYGEASCEGLNVFFGWECLRPLLQGKPAVVIPDDHIFDPVRLVDTLSESGITRIVVPPSLFESVLDHPAVGPELSERLRHMEVVFLMGEVVPTRVVDKAAALLPAHVQLVNAYSTWESLDVSFADLLPGPAGEAAQVSSFAPVGRILDGSAAILLNDQGQPVPYGGVGELYFAGPGVAAGYLDDPAKTAESFVPCPASLADSSFAGELFYRTGDRARFRPGGDLEILGRTGDIVKLRGFKVSLRAVESVLEDQAGVARVIVRPVLDSRTKQPAHLLAYVLGEQGKPSDTVLARSRRKARSDLPEYAQPRHFIGLDALPISQNGSRKLDLSALPAPPDEPREAGGTVNALTTTEQRLAQAWCEVLGTSSVEPDDNFFDVGGDSLSAARLSGLLAERLGISLPVIDVFQFSTLRAMAAHCAAGQESDEPAAASARRARRSETTRLAVVGMAGRFPGAPTLDAFWENLKNGTDSLTTFSAEQLRKKGVAEKVLAHPKWVPAAQLLNDADKFDAEFWGIGRREAVMMDPQHRVFTEVAWSALEQAGYARRNNPYRRRTGVFAACGIDGYLIHHLEGGGLTEPLDPAGVFLTEIGNEKDYIATRVAYLLDLGGPALTVTSACSSALAAVAQAAQSIVSGQCDMAIAGASSLNFPNFGYRYEDGLVGSADGHVRPFDDAASGTLFGDAVGAVVLKRLDDAIEDGDHIWAVLTGFGVSNDGRMKAGYTAPSARAQAQCISDAITMAGIGSGQLSYVECHATATHVGDAIEIKGLLDAFSHHSEGGALTTASCSLGSVKGNIGHANCAAGITGFLKTVLCLHHRTLVPTVNYRTLNPKLVDFVDCDGSPFTVQEAHEEWTVADPEAQLPRRAGVSSFGIGGTNAHVILEEAPEPAPEETGQDDPRPLHLVTVSARSETALRRNADALARFIEGLPDAEVAPAVRSLHMAREPHALRGSAVVGQGSAAGLDELRRLGEQRPPAASREGRAATVAFCFSGQGSQTAGMARGLYRGRADGGRFRRHFDAVCESLAGHLADDPAALVLGADDTSVMRPTTTQCGLFAVEYALARTLMDIGVTPVAVAGHSIGEYAAAVVSGLLTLEEGAALVAVRAQATEDLLHAGAAESGPGGMLSVVGDEERLADWLAGLAGRRELWLAVDNAPGRTVLSGTAAALREAAAELPPLGFTCRPVPVSHPFHSGLMAPVAARIDVAAAGLAARMPVVPMASNLTGSWLDSRYQPDTYWGSHVTSKVRWRDDVDTLLKWEPDILLEIGPGNVLTTLTRKCLEHRGEPGPLPLATMPDARNRDRDDEVAFLGAVGELWCHGVDLDFAAFHDGERGRSAARHLLPTYSFDRTSYWTRPDASPYVDREPGAVPAGADTGATGQAPQQLVRFVEKPSARMKLYCFPYAGGNSGAFRSWAHAAPQWLDVVAVELPGRNGQAQSTVPENDHDDTAFLAGLAAALRSDAGSAAVAFCGLSFGASVVLDLLGGPMADWARGGRVTVVSVAGRAPIRPGAGTAGLPLDSYLMVPDEVRDDVRWRSEVLPLLQADLAFDARAERRTIERQERGGTPVIDSPLQVHCGTEDPSFPSTSAEDWAAVTESPVVEVNSHTGSHDFMLHHRERILDQLVVFLDRLDPRDAPDHGRWTGRLHEVRWVPAQASATLDAPDPIRWIDFDAAGPAAATRFLQDTLTEPESKAALVCRLPAEQTPSQCCSLLLKLLQSVAQEEVRGQLILVLPARDTSGLVTGMTRSFVHEEPGLAVQRVYVHQWPPAPRGDDGPEGMDQLLRRVRSHPEETDLLYRRGHLLAQRLLPVAPLELPPGTLGAAAGSYLITGGTGGIGRVVTDWLIHHQGVESARVVVTGRTAPQDLRRGARFLEMDFARPLDAGAVAARTGPLAGIIHLAGLLDDGVLRNLDPSRFPAVLAPKLALPQLSELGREAGAPWIAAFSSTSALLGAPGQANYAAANGWMDAHAMWSAPEGGPSVVSINWGTWGDVGMAADSAKALDAARAGGETPLRSGTALSLFGKAVGTLLSGSPAGRNLAVCDVAWPRSPWDGMPLVSGLPAMSPQNPPADRPRPADPRPTADPGATMQEGQDDGIRSFLSAYVHRWDASKRLVDLGLDSLDFARIRGDFGRLFGKDVPLAAIAKPDQRLSELYAFLSEC